MKKLFLIDGLGAFLTAFFLFVILRTFNEYIGMPKSILTLLSIIALVFGVYSFSCFFFLNKNRKPFLLTICIANILYCCLTLGLIIYYFPQLTILGITYFLLEIIVIGVLVYYEINVLKIASD
jgi:hypothetical protein